MSDRATGSFAARVTVEALERDPYPIYARLRDEEPVAWVPAVGMWLATRWEEALRVASEPDLFAADMPGSPIDRSFGSPTILTCDGEVHQELRRGVGARLRPREVEGYVEELIGPIADRLLDEMTAGRLAAELMAEYLEPVSVLGLGALLGLEDLDAAVLRRWFAGLAEGATNFESDPGKQATSDAACAEIDREIGPRLTRLAAEPDDSLISHMLHEGLPDGESRSPDLVMPSLKVLLLGGMQEPGHGAGTVLFCLLCSPTRTSSRRYAPTRTCCSRQRLATFGFGPHFCSGHAFARALERIALERLLERAPDLRPAPGEDVPFSGWEFRAPRALPVVWA